MTPGKVSRLLLILACAIVTLHPGSSAFAQQSTRSTPRTVEARIVEAIDETRLTTLKGNTRPEARAEHDRGRVSPNLPMGDLVLVLRRSPEQQAAFESLLTALQDPSSPQFHHWLTPDQIGQKYGPAASDIATVSQYLQNHGFHVDEVSRDHLAITFGGSAGQIEAAFHTEIHNLQVNGQAHIANMTDPKIPEALTPVVVGVKALHNFFPRPQHKVGSIVRRNSNGTWERIGAPAVDAKAETKSAPAPANARHLESPDFDGGPSGGSEIEDISPYDFATIYNVLPLWNASTPIDGTGQKIAIAGTSKIIASDVTTFRSAFGLPTIAGLTQVVANGSDPGVCTGNSGACTADDEYENTLDVEWSSAVAKGASVVLVVSGSTTPSTDTVYSSASYIINHNVASIMSVSYGECELGLGASGNTSYNNLWSTAYAAGIAVFVSSGDQGSAVCDAGGSSQQGTPYGAQYGLSVSGLSSTPYNTAVGGTDFAWGWDTNGQTTYWNSTSDAHLANAKGYIPEFPWNSTCSNPLFVAAVNKANSSNYTASDICEFSADGQLSNATSLVDTVGGSGGASNCIDGDGSTLASCTKGYAKPAWQAGVSGIPADGVRDVPDISLFAANGFSGSAYVVCVTDGSGNSCSYTAGSEPVGQEVGGTSVSSPAMAGIMALINQKAKSVQGNPNVELYNLASKETYSGCVSNNVPLTGSACIFNDITTGTIAMPCDAGSPDCTVTGQTTVDNYGILNGWSSTAGYDLATGLGSLNVANLVNTYAATAGPTASLSPTSLSFPSTAVGSTAAIQTVTLSNTGTSDLTGIAITISGTDASSFKETDTCGTDLGAASSCVITVTFKPAVAGASLTATLSIADNATGSPQTVALTGSTPVPAVTLSPTSLTFASSLEGVAATPQVITVTNSGGAALTITGVTISGTNPTSFSETNTCSSVAASATCAITVTFKPAATGALSATLSIADNASNTPQTVTLSGTGTAPAPVVTLTPASLTFSATDVGVTSAAQTVTVKNTGNASLTVSGVTISGAAASSYSETNTCTTVAANATCTVSVTFKPTAGGALAAVLNIADNATGSPQTVALTGTGTVVAPVVALTPTSLTFPSTTVGIASVAQVITVKNTGNATLTISSVSVGGTNASSFAKTSTCASVAANASCTISVTFTPTTFGTLKGSVSITDNASGSPQAIALTGVGIEAGSYSLSASAVSFAAGSGGASTITATGTGGYFGIVTLGPCTLTTSPSGAVNAPACTIGTSPITVPKNGAGTGTVNFTSSAPGSAFRKQNASLDSLRIFGEGAITIAGLLILALPARRRAWRSMLNRTLGVLILTSAIGLLSSCGGGSSKTYIATVSPTSLTFASTNVGSTAATQTVTLSNTGTGALSFSSATIGGTNASSFTQTNTCSSSLAASASCTITVSFSPTQTGALSGTLTVTDGATTGSPQTVALTGTGTSAGTTAGVYTYTVTGTDAAGVKQTATITVTVS